VSGGAATLSVVSIQPVAPPHLLTVAEYLEIGEIEPGYSELVEGRLLMSPSPTFRHSRAGSKFWAALDAQVAAELVAVMDIDVDLQLGPEQGPGTVRRPDVIVVRRIGAERVDREGGVLRAADVLLAVEFVSPGSRRMDHVMKRAEYADAGIPHYWIIDLDEPVSLLACHLAGEFGYVDGGDVTGTFRTVEPFRFEIDLEALLD
jgi:Uma2 family endonuclease